MQITCRIDIKNVKVIFIFATKDTLLHDQPLRSHKIILTICLKLKSVRKKTSKNVLGLRIYDSSSFKSVIWLASNLNIYIWNDILFESCNQSLHKFLTSRSFFL